MRLLFVVITFLLLTVSGWAKPSFEQIVEALKLGNDRKALESSQALEKAGESSFGLFYNQGLAWRNLGDLPQARASFEQALLLRPHDLSTRRRLREVETKLGPKVLALDVRGTPWWSQSQAEVLLLLPGVALLGLGLRSRWKKRALPPVPTALLWIGGLGLVALFAATAPPVQRAVVIDKSAPLLPAASPEKPGEAIPGGVLVEVLEQRDHYVKVSLADGKTGWLRLAQLRRLAVASSL